MQCTKRHVLWSSLALGLVLAWTVLETPVFAQRSGRGDSRGSMSSRSGGASSSRGGSFGSSRGSANTSRSSFNSTGRSLGSAGGIGGSTRNLTPSYRNPAPRSNTIVPEIRKPSAQSKTIVPNLRNLPSVRREFSANGRNSTPDYQTAPSRRIVLPPRGKEQPAVHTTQPSLSEKRTVDSNRSSSNFRVYPLRENAAPRSDGLSTRPGEASNGRERSADWKAVSERLRSLSTAQGQTPSENKDRLSDWRSALANRTDLSPHVPSLSPNHGPLAPFSPSVPSEHKDRSPSSKPGHRDITPYRSIFKPYVDSSVRGTPGGGSSHDGARHGGGPSSGSSYHGSDRSGVDHRGAPHGTPRHDYRMHGELDRHSLRPGHYHYGRQGYGYRGSSFSIYFGSPLYSSSYYYDDEPYYGVPYYVPYAVPVPYAVETVVVEPAMAAPATVQNGAVISAAGDAAVFQLQAEQAFQDQRYEDAARLSNHAIVEDSQNGKLHLFASQTFFALEDYASAAAAVQQGASLLDRSEWGFVVENYEAFYRSDDYVLQMAKLDRYIEQNPEAAYAFFLRGYHFLYLGHEEAARNNLAKAIELESRDVLAAELLKMAGGQVPDTAVERPEGEVIPRLPAGEVPGLERSE